MAQLTHFYTLLPFWAFTLPPQRSPGQIRSQETPLTQQPHSPRGGPGGLWWHRETLALGTDSPGFTCQHRHFLAGTEGPT